MTTLRHRPEYTQFADRELEEERELDLEFRRELHSLPGFASVTPAGHTPLCPKPIVDTISRFPRYQNTVRSLPPAEQQKIIRLAGLIRRSFRPSCRPFVTVRLVGHADRDVQRGPRFEQQISLERARTIHQALVRSIGNREISSRIAWQPSGAGATSLLVPNPRTEAERARNRRVEIELSAGAPVPGDATNRPVRTLAKFEVGQARLRPSHAMAINHVAHHIVASWRQRTPIRTVRLVGHTDITEKAPHNRTLANARASAVQRSLAAAIDRLWSGLSARIRFVPQSPVSSPTSSDRTQQGRALNRKVEIFLPTKRPLESSRLGPGISTARLSSVVTISGSAPSTKPKVVLLPGIMGSALRDPTVPDSSQSGRGSTKALCRAKVIPSLAFRAFEAAIAAALLPIAPSQIPVVLAAIETAFCDLDMHVIWGAIDMLPWLFIPTDWCARLVDGDGQFSPGNVVPDGVLRILSPYDLFLRQLGPLADVLPFSYDWRLSNSVNALNLEKAILAKWWPSLREEEVERILPDDRVTLVAHSMGGLVSRNFLESPHRKGPHLVKHLITAGTPHDGAPATYCHFNRKSLPFGLSLFDVFFSPGVVAGLLAGMVPALSPILRSLPRILVPFLMGADMQLELVRSFAGVIQLLPNSPFAGAPEAITTSYARMNHLRGAGRPVLDVIDLMRGDLFGGTAGRPLPGRGLTDLNTFLSNPVPGTPKPVTYHTLGSGGRSTVTAFDVSAPPNWVSEQFVSCALGNVRADFRAGGPKSAAAGDGTVPLASAHLLPPGSNIIVPAPRAGVEHGKLLEDLEVRKYCFRQIGVTEPTREMEEELVEIEPITAETYLYSAGLDPEIVGLEAW